jgi:hypothetical protein
MGRGDWQLHCLALSMLLGLGAGLAPRAEASPLHLLFAGTTTGSQECADGTCVDFPGGAAVSYEFVVDFARLGEVVHTLLRDGSTVTITPIPDSFYARRVPHWPPNPGTAEMFDFHFGRGSELFDRRESHDSIETRLPMITESLGIMGVGDGTWSVGTHFAGGESRIFVPLSESPTLTAVTDSALVLTAIQVPEPDLLGTAGALGLGVLAMLRLRRRAIDR